MCWMAFLLLSLRCVRLGHGDVVLGREAKDVVVDLVLFVKVPHILFRHLGPVVLLHLAHRRGGGDGGGAQEVLAVARVAHHLNQHL